MQNFLNISDCSAEELMALLTLARDVKADFKAGKANTALSGKTLAMIFQKPSNRTRLSFELGMAQLGGRAIYVRDEEVGLGTREPVKDIARVMSQYVDGVMLRAKSHQDVDDFATYASIPVINGLSDLSHPCQSLADMLTILEYKGQLDGVRLTYMGDVNNVCLSLMTAATLLNVDMVVSCPAQYVPVRDAFPSIRFIEDPSEAIRSADVVYTDVWVSMGQEAERVERMDNFQPYQVNLDLLGQAKPDAVFMHCLPAHRGDEVTDDVMESAQSIVFDQAENRIHAQKAVLLSLLS